MNNNEKVYIFNGIKIILDINNMVILDMCKRFLSMYKCKEEYSDTIKLKINFEDSIKDRFNSDIFKREYIDEHFYTFGQLSYFNFNKDTSELIGVIDSKIKDNRTLLCTINFHLTEHLTRLFFNKGYYPIHAAAVEYNNKGIALIGNPGVGKTTTLLKLLKYNFNVLSDDRPLINKKGDMLNFFRPFNISKDIFSMINNTYDNKLIVNDFTSKKYQLNLNDNKIINTTNLTNLNTIIFLNKYSNDSEFKYEKLSKKNSMKEFITLNFPLYESNEINHLIELSEHISCIDSYKINLNYSNKWFNTFKKFLKDFND